MNASGASEALTLCERSTGHPLGWEGMALCVRIACEHPEWDTDKVERRARAMVACNVDTFDQLARKLRRRTP